MKFQIGKPGIYALPILIMDVNKLFNETMKLELQENTGIKITHCKSFNGRSIKILVDSR